LLILPALTTDPFNLPIAVAANGIFNSEEAFIKSSPYFQFSQNAILRDKFNNKYEGKRGLK
jgi:hypothetical protein